MNKEKRIGCFLVPFVNAFVGFWDIIDFSLSRAFSQEIFGFLEFLTRCIKKIIKLPTEGPNKPHPLPLWN
jgi:hypothetical protein